MELQVLVSTMNQNDHGLLSKMNIHSNALIINQNCPLKREKFEYHEHTIEWFDCPERGIGKSRNTALIHAVGTICLFADDDVVYHDHYSEQILSDFNKNPNADLIIYNVSSINPARPEYVIRQFHQVHFYNCLRYGTFRIAVRLNRIRKKRIYFSQLFGGGSRYGSGEDSLFLMDCIRSGLKVYASPAEIGIVDHGESTWFSGYTEKYFFDKGALFCALSMHFAKILCLQFCIRHPEIQSNLPILKILKIMQAGINDYKGLQENEQTRR